MYPQCRHLRPGGATCNSPSVKGSYWCFFHIAPARAPNSSSHLVELPNGRFASREKSSTTATLPVPACWRTSRRERRPIALRKPRSPTHRRCRLHPARPHRRPPGPRRQPLDPKRAGLLLYGLQVASANVKNNLSDGNVRTITYTEHGTRSPHRNTASTSKTSRSTPKKRATKDRLRAGPPGSATLRVAPKQEHASASGTKLALA